MTSEQLPGCANAKHGRCVDGVCMFHRPMCCGDCKYNWPGQVGTRQVGRRLPGVVSRDLCDRQLAWLRELTRGTRSLPLATVYVTWPPRCQAATVNHLYSLGSRNQHLVAGGNGQVRWVASANLIRLSTKPVVCREMRWHFPMTSCEDISSDLSHS